MAFPTFSPGDVLNASDMNAVGLWLVRAAAFTTAATVTVDDAFTADFQNYLLVVRYTTSGANNLTYVNRAAGSNATSNYNEQRLQSIDATTTSTRVTAQASVRLGLDSAAALSLTEMLISGPALAEPTVFQISNNQSSGGAGYGAPQIRFAYGNHSTATAYDGFQLAVGAGSTTGTYQVFGLRS